MDFWNTYEKEKSPDKIMIGSEVNEGNKKRRCSDSHGSGSDNECDNKKSKVSEDQHAMASMKEDRLSPAQSKVTEKLGVKPKQPIVIGKKLGPTTIKIGNVTKQPIGPKKPPVPITSVFNDDSEEEEEMPAEARMRMKNIGRDTPTSSGPNSFGKTKHGFVNTRVLTEKSCLAKPKEVQKRHDQKPCTTAP